MDNNQTYIEILVCALQNKSKVLDEIIEITNLQEKMLVNDDFMDLDSLDDTIEKKGILVYKINELNDGFESIYEKIKDDIIHDKSKYANEIIQLKELIKVVTEKSIQIQTTEKKNMIKFNNFMNSKKKQIKEFKVSSKTATSYYKNMADQHRGQSYFLDKKK